MKHCQIFPLPLSHDQLLNLQINLMHYQKLVAKELKKKNAFNNNLKCNCNKIPTIRTVSKDGPNKGKLFWGCPITYSKQTNKQCRFFKKIGIWEQN